MLAKRDDVYAAARQANPNRWSTTARNWQPVNEVHLNTNTPKPTEQKNLRKAA
jgi:hypothetical protein